MMSVTTTVKRRYSHHLCILLGIILLGLVCKYLYHSPNVVHNTTAKIKLFYNNNNISAIDHIKTISDKKEDFSTDEEYYDNEVNQEIIDDRPGNSEVRKVVHFVWCGYYSGPFAYRNYLAVKSAYMFLQPDRIYFHCNEVPNKFHDYETWFNDTLKEYPWLVIKHGEYNCSQPLDVKRYIFYALYQHQGVYIGEDTIITGVGPGFWTNTSFRSTIDNRYNNNGYAAITENHTHYDMLKWEMDLQSVRLSNASEACIPIEDRDLNKRITAPIPEGYLQCVYISKKFFPKYIWGRSDILGKTLNYIMYEEPNTPEPVPSEGNDDLIPNIGHVFWLSGKEMNYLFYLCCLSLIYVVKVDTLYVHGDVPPTGKYWDLIKQDPKLMFIKKTRPSSIWGQEALLSTGMSNIFRTDIMIRYGGIYSDVDAIWTQPIPEHIRRYGAVAALDWAHFFRNYPDYINLGVTLGKKGSKFWHLYLDSMKDYKNVMGYNGILKPYKVYERHPETLFMYPELQVMCFQDDCYPLSGKNYTEINWRKDTHAFHWTHPDPFELTSEEALLASNSVFADIGKNVLREAGLLRN